MWHLILFLLASVVLSATVLMFRSKDPMHAAGYAVRIVLGIIALYGAFGMKDCKAADFYGIVGIGTGTLEQVKLDKWWYQERSDHRWEEGTNVYKAGIGLDVSRHLALEVDYRDLGRFNSVARWVGQEDLYNPITNQCEPAPCPPNQTAYGTGTVKGVVLSAVVKYPLDRLGGVTPYARLGVMHFEQSYNVYYTPDPGSGEPDTVLKTWHESRSGFAPVYGVGVQYEWVWAEWTNYHSIASTNSAFQNASTFMLGLNVPF